MPCTSRATFSVASCSPGCSSTTSAACIYGTVGHPRARCIASPLTSTVRVCVCVMQERRAGRACAAFTVHHRRALPPVPHALLAASLLRISARVTFRKCSRLCNLRVCFVCDIFLYVKKIKKGRICCMLHTTNCNYVMRGGTESRVP